MHGTLAGTTTRKLCERAFQVHGGARYTRLVGISNGHLYNLHQHKTYQLVRGSFDKTCPTKINIGERRQTNDNASTVRKHLGYSHIPQHFASRVNEFTVEVLSPYLIPPRFAPVTFQQNTRARRDGYASATVIRI